MSVRVTERLVPLDGNRADDAREHLARLEREHADNPNVRVAGMVETRSLGNRTPRTTAKWCAVIREAKLEGAE